MDQPLRQPRTFWQWLTNQEGTLFAPPLPPAPRTALQYLDDELQRVHEQIDNLREEGLAYVNGQTALNLIARLDRLHVELVQRSQGEAKPATPPVTSAAK